MRSASMPEPAGRLRQQQMAFAAHIRNPAVAPAPADVEDRRMQIYRDLFFNNICNFLASNFPVLRKIHGETAWRKLAREFYTEHRAHTPLFPEIPREFLRYVQEQRQDRAGDPPFLLELAHYEWVELALSLETHEIDGIEVEVGGDLLQGVPLLSPLAWPLAYQFPVHRLSPDYQPSTPPDQATRLLVYRDRADQVRFMEINPVTWLLLEKLQAGGHSGQEVLQSVAAEIGRAGDEAVLEHGHKILQDLRQRDVILGVRTSS
ncbi:MAG TPA: putative DNA-binding domain-containing protein [Xanthomonadales bacterium]|nr:putative DNA-binding domain-containing protein [Xanthomonadales bacterium]